MIAPKNLTNLYALVKARMPEVQLGGITGDSRHVENGGYHISRALLLTHGQTGDYSIKQRRDQGGDPDNACAIDLTYGETASMHAVTNRLLAAKDDPRMKPVREFFGCQHTGGPIVGWDWSSNGPTTSSDLSHRWHVHISLHRDTVDTFDVQALADVITGTNNEEFTIMDKATKDYIDAQHAAVLAAIKDVKHDVGVVAIISASASRAAKKVAASLGKS